jgi:hypothetical protein
MQKYHMPNLEDSLFSRVKNEKGKKKKRHRRMNRRYPRSKRWCTWYTTQKAKLKLALSDELTVHFVEASSDWKEKNCKR